MSYTHLLDERPRARKRHRCFICSCTIWPGTIYRKSHFVFDGSAYTIKEHVECARVAAKWCDRFDYPDGYQGEDVYEAMREGLQDYSYRDRAYRPYKVGDLSRDERIVWSRFRQSQARFEIRQRLKKDRWITA